MGVEVERYQRDSVGDQRPCRVIGALLKSCVDATSAATRSTSCCGVNLGCDRGRRPADSALDDLGRLVSARSPAEIPGSGWDYGKIRTRTRTGQGKRRGPTYTDGLGSSVVPASSSRCSSLSGADRTGGWGPDG